MAFWTDGIAPEPKRQFRFRVMVLLFPTEEDGMHVVRQSPPLV